MSVTTSVYGFFESVDSVVCRAGIELFENSIPRIGPLSNPQQVICPHFSLDLISFFREHLIQCVANKMQDFRNFVQHTCILIFYTEQVYLKL